MPLVQWLSLWNGGSAVCQGLVPLRRLICINGTVFSSAPMGGPAAATTAEGPAPIPSGLLASANVQQQLPQAVSSASQGPAAPIQPQLVPLGPSISGSAPSAVGSGGQILAGTSQQLQPIGGLPAPQPQPQASPFATAYLGGTTAATVGPPVPPPQCQSPLSVAAALRAQCLVQSVDQIDNLQQDQIQGCCGLTQQYFQPDCFQPCLLVQEPTLSLLRLWRLICRAPAPAPCPIQGQAQLGG